MSKQSNRLKAKRKQLSDARERMDLLERALAAGREERDRMEIENADLKTKLVRMETRLEQDRKSITEVIGGLNLNLDKRPFPKDRFFSLNIAIHPEMYSRAFMHGNGNRDGQFRDARRFVHYAAEDVKHKIEKLLMDSIEEMCGGDLANPLTGGW